MVFALDVLLGILLLGAIAVLAAGRRRASQDARRAGWLLVAIPLPLAVGVHLAMSLPQTLDQTFFITGIAAFALGAALLLGREDEDWREPSEDGPPWWPEFEQAFREYSRSRDTRPLARV